MPFQVSGTSLFLFFFSFYKVASKGTFCEFHPFKIWQHCWYQRFQNQSLELLNFYKSFLIIYSKLDFILHFPLYLDCYDDFFRGCFWDPQHRYQILFIHVPTRAQQRQGDQVGSSEDMTQQSAGIPLTILGRTFLGQRFGRCGTRHSWHSC